MNTISLSQPHSPGRTRTRAALARLLATVARLFERPRHEYLDDAALRDLGLSRSELGSFEAEAHGIAAATRLRVFEHLHRGM